MAMLHACPVLRLSEGFDHADGKMLSFPPSLTGMPITMVRHFFLLVVPLSAEAVVGAEQYDKSYIKFPI